jgi:hypothetical protein
MMESGHIPSPFITYKGVIMGANANELIFLFVR